MYVSQLKNGHSVKRFCFQPPPGVTGIILKYPKGF